MLVDCRSHVWAYPGHLSDEFVNEANARSRGHRLDLHIPPKKHLEAMAGVDKVIVFGLRAHHSGLRVPNGLRNINHFTEGTNLPRLASEEIERLIYSPTLTCLGLESA